jgi:hypothetical protein
LLYAIVLTLSLGVATAFAQPARDAPPANEVAGLKLPAPQKVNYDEGFVTLKADCKGTVKWLVLSTSAKIKFKVNSGTPNEIDIAVPPYEAAITVFCIGVIDGKQTDFARTDVAVEGPAGPGPTPAPIPPDVKGPFHLSIIEDPLKRTEAIKGIVDNPALFKQLRDKKVTPRVYTVNDPVLKTKKFDAVLTKYGAPMLILQDDNGKALVIGSLPASSAELLKLVGPYVGGF